MSVGGVDPALAGKWVISGSRHEFGYGFYRTRWSSRAARTDPLHGLLGQGGGGAATGSTAS